jgi:hypothetical protein
VLRFGCSYEAIADTTCSATTLRDRRDEWIARGVFAQPSRVAREAYDRIVGLLLDDIAVETPAASRASFLAEVAAQPWAEMAVASGDFAGFSRP